MIYYVFCSCEPPPDCPEGWTEDGTFVESKTKQFPDCCPQNNCKPKKNKGRKVLIEEKKELIDEKKVLIDEQKGLLEEKKDLIEETEGLIEEDAMSEPEYPKNNPRVDKEKKPKNHTGHIGSINMRPHKCPDA